MKVLIFASELQEIAAHMGQYDRLETGGSLYGYWTHSRAPIVHFVTGPGPKARHESHAFYQDEAYMGQVSAQLWERFGLQHIGEWHSHHRLGLAWPSDGDIRTVRRGMASAGFEQFLLSIGNFRSTDDGVNLGFFLFDGQVRFVDCEVTPLPGTSPIRPVAQGLSPGQLLRRGRIRPSWRLARGRGPRSEPVARGVWYAERGVQRRLARELTSLQQAEGVVARLTPVGDLLRLEVELGRRQLVWTLSKGFPEVTPVLYVDGVHAEVGSWEVTSSFLDQSVAAAVKG